MILKLLSNKDNLLSLLVGKNIIKVNIINNIINIKYKILHEYIYIYIIL